MSKWPIAVIIVVVILVLGLFLGGYLPIGQEEPEEPPFVTDPREAIPELNASESTTDIFRGTLTVPGVAAHELEVDGTVYHKLDVLAAGTTTEVGRPEIPFLTHYFVMPRDEQGVPPDAVVQVEVLETKDYRNARVYPAQPPMEEAVGAEFPPFTIDEQAYQSEAPYPDKLYETETAKIGDIDLLILRTYPLQYTAESRLLQLRRVMEIEVDFNPQDAVVSPVTVVDDARYAPALPPPENGDTIEAAPITVTGFPAQIFDDPMYSFLIIAHHDFYSAAYRLAEHKRDLGWRVRLATTADVQPGGYHNPTLNTAIQDFVRDEWEKNRILSFRNDPNEFTIPQERDIKGYNLIRKHDEFYVEVVLWAEVTDSPLLYVYVDIDGVDPADYNIQIWGHAYNVYEGATVVHSGTAQVSGNRISLHFPWTTLFPSSTPDGRGWVVCELDDRAPDEGFSPLRWEEGVWHSVKHLLLIGDAEKIRPNLGMNEGLHVLTAEKPKANVVGTDLYYAIVQDKDDFYPDLSYGRLPVDTLQQADDVVDKIIAYETTAAGAAFRESFAVAGAFYDRQKFKPEDQDGTLDGTMSFVRGSGEVTGESTRFRDDVEAGDWIRIWGSGAALVEVDRVVDRTHLRLVSAWADPDASGTYEVWRLDGKDSGVFMNTAERVRSYLVDSLGYAADYHYTVDWFRSDPQKFNDGGWLPPELRRPTYAWDADMWDIMGELNSGDNLFILHRDHAEFFGWGDPPLKAWDVAAHATSASDLLPVMFSINCASGYFDNEYDYWRVRQPDGTVTQQPIDPASGGGWSDVGSINLAEALIRQPNGGAIGVIAATRLSYSWFNDVLTDGIISFMYPGYVGLESGLTILSSSQYLGDILNGAKTYAASRFDDPDWVQYYMEMFHIIGDPTLKVKIR